MDKLQHGTPKLPETMSATQDNQGELTHENRRVSAGVFYDLQLTASTGPQVEGVIRDDALKIVEHPATVWANLDDIVVPVLFPLECDSLAHKQYYDPRGGMDGVFMVSSTINLVDDRALHTLREIIETRDDIRSVILLQREGVDSRQVEDSKGSQLLDNLGINTQEEPMVDPTSDTVAQIIHFTGLPEFIIPLEGSGESLHDAFQALLTEGVVEVLPHTGTSLLRPDDLTDKLIEKIWNIYDKQLDILIEDHPAYQRLDRGLVVDMLKNPTGFNIVHFVDGEPACLFLGVTDLDQCEWLNTKLITSRYDDDVLYCPAMVTDFEKQGHNYASNIFKLLVDVAAKRGKNIRPYFECTDISAQYIPGILTKAINSTGLATIEVEAQERYRYRRVNKV